MRDSAKIGIIFKLFAICEETTVLLLFVFKNKLLQLLDSWIITAIFNYNNYKYLHSVNSFLQGTVQKFLYKHLSAIIVSDDLL